MKKKSFIIGIGTVAVIVAGFILFKVLNKSNQEITLTTVKVKKGTVSNTVTATGTVKAIKTVEVGTQVSGVIDKIYVDYNSHVKAGQLLAEIDKRTLTTQLENAEASLQNAQAELTLQKANYDRSKALADKNLVAQSDYDQVIYNYATAQASLKAAQLEYNKAKINLGYATIYSPIDGVVLERAVDEGQTVAASFSTPTLFSIANDLTQMQVEANIDEADIGKVKDSQRVSFKVDAFSDLKFEGRVSQIRLNPTTTNNVVTYTVIILAPNPDLKLMPGLTADITIFVEEAKDVLTVSSKALHFTPDQNMMAAYMMNAMKDSKEMTPQDGMEPAKDSNAGPQQGMAQPDSTKPTVWVKTGKMIHPVNVEVGIDDDLNAQIISGLKEGDEVVTAMTSAAPLPTVSASSGGSPFMPRPPSNSSSRTTKK